MIVCCPITGTRLKLIWFSWLVHEEAGSVGSNKCQLTDSEYEMPDLLDLNQPRTQVYLRLIIEKYVGRPEEAIILAASSNEM